MTDSVGARLRQGREVRRLSLQQVSEITKLRIHYLQALENDDYSAIPSAAQARGFLRLYAEFLELDVADLIPPAQPVAVPPASTPASTSAPVGPSPSRPGLWDGLRERLGRRAGKNVATVDAPVSAAAPVVAQEPSPVPEGPAAPAVPAPASSEIKTARARKAASGEVKKNAGN